MNERVHRGAPIGGRLHWLHCTACGLILLRNAVSQRAWQAACPGEQRISIEVMKRR